MQEPANQSESGFYSYVLVRRDIPLPDQVVQACHACQDAGKIFQQPEGCNLVLLETENQDSLRKALHKTSLMGIQWVVFNEPDDDMGLTAACCKPIQEPELRKAFRQYKLWA